MLVYVIDDNHTNLMLFEQLALKVAEDVVVRTFLDPVEAYQVTAQTMPDMIVVDFMMPVMDGHEYVDKVRKLPGSKDVPIVMVTANSDRPVRQKALELGVTDFLSKPVDPSEVRVRFRNLLALRRSNLQIKDRNKWLADEVRRATRQVVEREQELILRLSRASEFRDPETGAHIVRMAHYSHLIATHMCLDQEICDLILRAAPMHDIGKLGIPDGILLKPGRLTDDEMRVMTQHPRIGWEILKDSSSGLIRMGSEIALSHHEKWDGSGYPDRLEGKDIPISARIVAVADVFDALTSARPYKPAWPVDKAREFLKQGRGTHFDPACVDAFFARWEEAMVIMERFREADTMPDLLMPT